MNICNNRENNLGLLYVRYIVQYITEPINYLIISPMGGMVLLWLALLPHSNKIPGSNASGCLREFSLGTRASSHSSKIRAGGPVGHKTYPVMQPETGFGTQ